MKDYVMNVSMCKLLLLLLMFFSKELFCERMKWKSKAQNQGKNCCCRWRREETLEADKILITFSLETQVFLQRFFVTAEGSSHSSLSVTSLKEWRKSRKPSAWVKSKRIINHHMAKNLPTSETNFCVSVVTEFKYSLQVTDSDSKTRLFKRKRRKATSSVYWLLIFLLHNMSVNDCKSRVQLFRSHPWLEMPREFGQGLGCHLLLMMVLRETSLKKHPQEEEERVCGSQSNHHHRLDSLTLSLSTSACFQERLLWTEEERRERDWKEWWRKNKCIQRLSM